MRIACFYSDSTWASWSLSRGLVSTLRHMSHEVLDCPVPAGLRVTQKQIDAAKKVTPERLSKQDAILICGPEHCSEFISFVYGQAEWAKVSAPKLGWYHESFVRPDYTLQFENMKPWVDEHFFPSPDDAEKHGGTWLPVGVDTDMFCAPICCCGGNLDAAFGLACEYHIRSKAYDVGFIGLMYDKRRKFHEALKPELKQAGIELTLGNVQMTDLSGCLMKEQTDLLARNYRQMKILLNLPTLSSVLVAKVLEGMACGTCVVSPAMSPRLQELVGFKDDEHLAFYDESNPAGCAKKLKGLLKDDARRMAMAEAGYEEVRANHSLKSRLQTMLAKVAVPCG